MNFFLLSEEEESIYVFDLIMIGDSLILSLLYNLSYFALLVEPISELKGGRINYKFPSVNALFGRFCTIKSSSMP